MNLSDVMIQWMWPSREVGEPNIGFGVHATRFVRGVAAIAVFLILSVVLFVVGAPSNVLLGASMVSLCVTVAAIWANGRYYRFYEVDQMARPIRP